MSSHSTRQPPNKGKNNNEGYDSVDRDSESGVIEWRYLPDEIIGFVHSLQPESADSTDADRTTRFCVVY